MMQRVSDGDRQFQPTSVLLVEDNPDHAELTVEALRAHGFVAAIELARDGQEALDRLLAEETELPALVLLDLKLPKVDGLEVLRRLRASVRTRYLPIAVLTSSARQEDVTASYLAGTNCFVRKPVEFAQFRSAVQAIGLFWLQTNERPTQR